MNTVDLIRTKGLCCGCGICAAVCPQKCIVMSIQSNGATEPTISRDCISCGVCISVCPQVFDKKKVEAFPRMLGDKNTAKSYEDKAFLVQSKDSSILSESTSGGFATTIIHEMLDSGEYSSAFVVDTYKYDTVVHSARITAESKANRTPKSRYIQVDHEKEVEYILAHRDERIIFVGTPCYFYGLEKVITQYSLNRENYLLIGLFCDKTMTSHVWDYFNHCFANEQLKELYFRTKENSRWPGDVCLVTEKNGKTYLPRKERIGVKEYFAPECCLYCADKLNAYADFSIGDNYIKGKQDNRGSNCLIVRTERAHRLWNVYGEKFSFESCSVEEIEKSQNIYSRDTNLRYLAFSQKEEVLVNSEWSQISSAEKKQYINLLDKIKLGQSAQYSQIYKNVKTAQRKSNSILRRGANALKRYLRKK